MLKNKQFKPGALAVLIICFIGMYLFSALSNDGTNILTTYFATFGWSTTQITNPMTYAGLALIVITPIMVVFIMKVGPKQALLIGMLVCAVAVIGMAFSGGNYTLYFITAFVVRVLCVFLQQVTFLLCANWFIRYRGTALGIVTGGGPICSATFISIMMSLAMNPEIGFAKSYTGLAIIVAIFVIVSFFILKNTPEEVGCYPDGSDLPPSDDDKEENITLKEVLKKKESWILIVVYGVLQFILYAMMAFYVTNMMLSGMNADTDHYMLWLTIGCVVGFPMSTLLGIIDDKFGSVVATYTLMALYLCALLPMAFMGPGKVGLLILGAFGIASMTGGLTTLFPSTTAYVFGRKKFMAAQKWIMMGCSIFIAFTPAYMSHFVEQGSLRPAYLIMTGALVVAAIVMLPMIKVKDANLANRSYANKQ